MEEEEEDEDEEEEEEEEEEADEAEEAPTLVGLRETGLSTEWMAETQLCCELGREGKRRH